MQRPQKKRPPWKQTLICTHARLSLLGNQPPQREIAEVQAHMRMVGKKVGKLGSKARAANLTAEERRESARKAAQARWAKAKRKKVSR